MVKLKKKIVGCEHCVHRSGDFFKDLEDPELIRSYCKARHVNVLAEEMSKHCDFYETDPEVLSKEKEAKKREVKGI